jgi:hypothetical protein
MPSKRTQRPKKKLIVLDSTDADKGIASRVVLGFRELNPPTGAEVEIDFLGAALVEVEKQLSDRRRQDRPPRR